jgi:legumain
LAFAFLLAFASAGEYAVIVAGSNGYYNYRHQADVCHAYHTLLDHGVPASNIILMSYDDVANDSENPFPGKLYNKPGSNSREYNEGCIKDYTGESVNSSNFLSIITGNKAGVKGGNGRVLESGPDDHVFINFVDHGAPGLIAFPSDYLYANDLITALETMHTKNMYKQLAFYLEACESGSMFSGILPANISIYAITAANTSESSWGTYCPPNDTVNGKELNTCLGDLFSVNWMQDADAANVSQETLQQQFENVKKTTSKSHVMQYGDLTFTAETIGEFEGEKQSQHASSTLYYESQHHWETRDVKLQYLMTKYQRVPSWETAEELMEEIVDREYAREVFETFAELASPYPDHLLRAQFPPTDFECLKSSMQSHEQYCGRMSDYALKFVQVLVNACESGVSMDEIDSKLAEACSMNDMYYDE